jgi:hypothetical protein
VLGVCEVQKLFNKFNLLQVALALALALSHWQSEQEKSKTGIEMRYIYNYCLKPCKGHNINWQPANSYTASFSTLLTTETIN